jgi:hypothetical protein
MTTPLFIPSEVEESRCETLALFAGSFDSAPLSMTVNQ